MNEWMRHRWTHPNLYYFWDIRDDIRPDAIRLKSRKNSSWLALLCLQNAKKHILEELMFKLPLSIHFVVFVSILFAPQLPQTSTSCSSATDLRFKSNGLTNVYTLVKVS